jgi:hypothetical protein
MSGDIYDRECHVVVHVYDYEKERWVIADPAQGCILFNDQNETIDIIAMRSILESGATIAPRGNQSEKCDDNFIFLYNHYIVKNCFMFITFMDSGCYYNKIDKEVLVHPKNYTFPHTDYSANWIKTSNTYYLFN